MVRIVKPINIKRQGCDRGSSRESRGLTMWFSFSHKRTARAVMNGRGQNPRHRDGKQCKQDDCGCNTAYAALPTGHGVYPFDGGLLLPLVFGIFSKQLFYILVWVIFHCNLIRNRE